MCIIGADTDRTFEFRDFYFLKSGRSDKGEIYIKNTGRRDGALLLPRASEVGTARTAARIRASWASAAHGAGLGVRRCGPTWAKCVGPSLTAVRRV